MPTATPAQQAFRRQVLNPFKLQLFLLRKLPLAWLAQAGLDLRAKRETLSFPRDGVTVVRVGVGELALSFANVDLAAPLVLTAADLEALFTGRHDHSALRGFLSQQQETVGA